jgi:hypothetical protein
MGSVHPCSMHVENMTLIQNFLIKTCKEETLKDQNVDGIILQDWKRVLFGVYQHFSGAVHATCR